MAPIVTGKWVVTLRQRHCERHIFLTLSSLGQEAIGSERLNKEAGFGVFTKDAVRLILDHILKSLHELGTVVHDCNTNIQNSEAGGLEVQNGTEIHSDSLSQKKRKTEKKPHESRNFKIIYIILLW